MTIEVVWRPRAREDLIELYVFIGSENPVAAERVTDRIEAKVALLAIQPRIGPRRPEIRPSVRILIEGSYLILCETHLDADQGPVERVEIVRIVHGRRDLRDLD
jgi:toxin ParE1/3/4